MSSQEDDTRESNIFLGNFILISRDEIKKSIIYGDYFDFRETRIIYTRISTIWLVTFESHCIVEEERAPNYRQMQTRLDRQTALSSTMMIYICK